MTDVPTLTSASAANYATLNPLIANRRATLTFSNGNLDASASTAWASSVSTIGMPLNGTDKWYAELTVNSGSQANGINVGITSQTTNALGGNTAHSTSVSGVWYGSNAEKWVDGTSSSYGETFTNGDVIGIAVDSAANTITFYKNNTSQGAISLTSNVTSGAMIGIDLYNRSVSMNFGQRPFAYTPPTGFKALNTYNLPTPTIKDGSDYFNPVLYTGNGSTQSITGVGFQPDWTWIKTRSNVASHSIFDVLRGVNNWLASDSPDAAFGGQTDLLTSFDSDGFSLGANTGSKTVNKSGYTFVAWNWKANGSGVSNTDGSITSTVSANTTSGFSIATYTGDGSNANRTVGHGLGVAPEMVIVKTRSEAARNWLIWHKDLTNYDYALLFTIDAQAGLRFGPSAPTSSVFGVYGGQGNRGTETFVSYCFAAIEGFSAFGKYTGNGSADGPFIYTGFRPAYILIKRSDSAADWYLYDSSRGPYNEDKAYLNPNSNGAENASLAGHDLLSNGFKVRTSITSQNVNGGTYIYAAFAENPFKYSLAR